MFEELALKVKSKIIDDDKIIFSSPRATVLELPHQSLFKDQIVPFSSCFCVIEVMIRMYFLMSEVIVKGEFKSFEA